MANRHGEFNVAHALAANASQGYFNAATVANDTPVLDAFIFSAGALPVLDRTENAFAEQAALLRLEGTIIDSFGVFDFPFGPGANGFRRRDRNRDVLDLVDLIQAEQLTGAFFCTNHKMVMVIGKWRSMSWRPACPLPSPQVEKGQGDEANGIQLHQALAYGLNRSQGSYGLGGLIHRVGISNLHIETQR